MGEKLKLDIISLFSAMSIKNEVEAMLSPMCFSAFSHVLM